MLWILRYLGFVIPKAINRIFSWGCTIFLAVKSCHHHIYYIVMANLIIALVFRIALHTHPLWRFSSCVVLPGLWNCCRDRWCVYVQQFIYTTFNVLSRCNIEIHAKPLNLFDLNIAYFIACSLFIRLMLDDPYHWRR